MKDRVENDPDYKNVGTKFIPYELKETGAGESVSGKAIVSSNSPTRISEVTPELLKLIGGKEGGGAGYNASNRGNANDTPGGTPGLTQMTVAQVMQAQKDKKFYTAGKYQIIPGTLNGLMNNAYGPTGVNLTDLFNEATQDKLATALIKKRLQTAGDKADLSKQLTELAKEFAVIIDPELGRGPKDGVAGNKATINLEMIKKAIGGDKISELSTGLADGRVALTLNSGEGSGSIINNYNTNVSGSTGGKQIASAFSSDAADLFINKSFAVTA